VRWIRQAPITAESIIVCVTLFACCLYQSATRREPFHNVQRAWGAVVKLEHLDFRDGIRRDPSAELAGPFDIWNGQWWRIPATAFHHGNLLHLVLNIGSAWYFGWYLERRWGSFAMLMFLIPATFLPIMAEVALGNAVVGFSGAISAMLGAVAVIRVYDRELAEEVPEEVITFSVGGMVLCLFLTVGGVVSIANTAHFVGLAYGALIGASTVGPSSRRVLYRVVAVIAHFWMLPGLFLAINPYWSGRYNWYLGTIHRPNVAEKYLERAVSWDPSLTGAWLDWARQAEQRQDPVEAWQRLIEGLSANRSSAKLMDSVRRQWRHLDPVQRYEASKRLDRVFGRNAKTWLDQIRANPHLHLLSTIDEPTSVTTQTEFALDQKIVLPTANALSGNEDQQPPMRPARKNDAMEGETL